LRLQRGELVEILHHHSVEVYVAESAGQAIGLLELDFRETPDAELQYFGVTPDWVGQGLGSAMMDCAIARVWRPGSGVERFWLHTCSLDHPAALAFYRKCGFRPYKRCVEICDDPRWTGEIARGIAPHIPLL
jgi:GNAT superfamily N-acetyltransferase